MLSLPSRPRRGFTMLELIVVIVILGVLAAIAVPTFKGVIDRSKDASTEATLSAVLRDASALAAFRGASVPTVFEVSEATMELPATRLPLVNGGMELDADANGVPDGWSIFYAPTATDVPSRSVGASGFGFSFTSTVGTGALSNAPRLASTPLPVTVGESYLVTARIRAPLGMTIELGGKGLDATGAERHTYPAATVVGTGGWQTLAVQVNAVQPRLRVTPGIKLSEGGSPSDLTGKAFSVDDVTVSQGGWATTESFADQGRVAAKVSSDGSALGVVTRSPSELCVLGRIVGGAVETWTANRGPSCTGVTALAGP